MAGVAITGASPRGAELLDRARRIAADVAGPAAADVDAHARFPKEAFDAIKAEGLLSALIPVEAGGGGCTYAEVAAMCSELGRACGSTSMIYAMHNNQLACLTEHGTGVDYFDDLLRRISAEQRLLASATTELGVGGNVRNSICAVEYDGDRFRVQKNTSVISYGDHVDDVMVTARRHADSPASDQVIVHTCRPELELRPDGDWDTLGMRGTCSNGYVLVAAGDVAQIVPDPYAVVSARTMLPATHIFWASTWIGIAEGAVDKARRFVRDAARKTPGTTPPGARRLVACQVSLQHLRGLLAGCLASFERARVEPELSSTIPYAVQMNNLKLDASETSLGIVEDAMYICGLAAYRNSGPFSLARELRDIHSARLMVHNDRIIESNSALLCLMREG